MKLPRWLHECPVCPELEPCPEPEPCPDCPDCPEIPKESVQERLETLLAEGYRPIVRTHTVTPSSEAARDELIDSGWFVAGDGTIFGWTVSGQAIDHSQGVIGATRKTLNEALVDSEQVVALLKERYPRRWE